MKNQIILKNTVENSDFDKNQPISTQNNQISGENTANSRHRVDNLQFLQENSDNASIKDNQNLSRSSDIAPQTEAQSLVAQGFSEDFDENQEISTLKDQSPSKTEDFTQKSQPCVQNSTFSDVIERDFNDFAGKYPNISKNALYKDKLLEKFAAGKENHALSEIFAEYEDLSSKIASNAVKAYITRKENESSSVGALYSQGSSCDVLFTKEQVLRMTPEEIKRNFTKIRESQAKW